MGLLVHLADHAGHTVSREALFRALWPGVVVSDDTLTQVVIKLRKALGDNARSPSYIQTVPKRGYRLLAPVEPVAVAMPPAAGGLGAGLGDRLANRRKRPLPMWTLGALGLLILLVLLLAVTLTPDTSGQSGGDPAQSAKAAADDLPTLSVQPFELLGGDESQAYLAQGLTLDLITDLSKLSGLWVIGSRSIMGQKSDDTGALSARYRVFGEVQRADGQIRVHVHLLDGQTERQLWSERYQRPFDNLFQLQEDIGREIASALSVKVREVERRRLAHRYTQNMQAYELFLRAQSSLLVRSKSENHKARRLYRSAIKLDPSFGRAYSGLALSHAADYRNQWADDGARALQRARDLARTALQIDAEIPEVYWVLAYVNAQQRQHEAALGLLRNAIALDQSFADAYALMGGINTYLGRPQKTPALIRNAIRLNPEAGYLYFLLLGRAYFFLQDWEQASINLGEALERNPANLEARLYLAAVLESAGDHEAAIWESDEILTLQPDFDVGNWLKTYPMTDTGQKQQLLSALAKGGLKAR